MNNSEFKKMFNEMAKINKFENAFGGWFKESTECIIVLDLQKSNFGDFYYLNIKIFLQGIFGKTYVRNKGLVKKDVGDIFTRQPKLYMDAFALDTPIEYIVRKKQLDDLFSEFIVPLTDKALSKSGIKELADKSEIYLLPAIKKELSVI